MVMTTEQLKVYKSLRKDEKEEFDYQSQKHPDWPFERVMTKLAFEKKIEETMGGGKDPDPNDPKIWESIVIGVRDFLKRFPLLKKVVEILNNAISNIISRGKQFIDDILEWLF